jgi:hypothetical protein
MLAVWTPATAAAQKATLTIRRPKKASVDVVSAVASVHTLVGVPVAVALLIWLASQFMLDFHEGLRAVFRAIFSSVKGAKRDSVLFCPTRNGSELNSEHFLDREQILSVPCSEE